MRLANDADCFTISEATDGAGQEARKAPELPGGLTGTKQESWVVFGVILGTGCGGGIAVDGKLVRLCTPTQMVLEWRSEVPAGAGATVGG